jgi:hypothetical protein
MLHELQEDDDEEGAADSATESSDAHPVYTGVSRFVAHFRAYLPCTILKNLLRRSGVHGRWRAQLSTRGRTIHLGTFATAEEAARLLRLPSLSNYAKIPQVGLSADIGRRAWDRAAVQERGRHGAKTNFHMSDYIDSVPPLPLPSSSPPRPFADQGAQSGAGRAGGSTEGGAGGAGRATQGRRGGADGRALRAAAAEPRVLPRRLQLRHLRPLEGPGTARPPLPFPLISIAPTPALALPLPLSRPCSRFMRN